MARLKQQLNPSIEQLKKGLIRSVLNNSPIVLSLSFQLGNVTDVNEMFQIFSRFFVRPHIRSAIQEYQMQVMQLVNVRKSLFLYLSHIFNYYINIVIPMGNE